MDEQQRHWEELKVFLSTAPALLNQNRYIDSIAYRLPNGDHISCILYDSLFYISSSDIFKIARFRHEMIGRPVDRKDLKFEEGIFSDLRKLKEDVHWRFEQSNSQLLDFMVSIGATSKAKRQKIYFWFSVPHDMILSSSVYRMIKREAPPYSHEKEIAEIMRNSPELKMIKTIGSINLRTSEEETLFPTEIKCSRINVDY